MIFFDDNSIELDENNEENKSNFIPSVNDPENIYKAVSENFDWGRQKEKSEGLFDDEGEIPEHNYCLNIKSKIKPEVLNLIEKNENKITKPTTLATPVKNFDLKKPEIFCSNQVAEDVNNSPKKILQKKRGRKNINQSKKKGEHNKYSPDNMMRKIKTYIMGEILFRLNESLIDKINRFYKISSEINENLKKNFNIELMQRTICDIFLKTKLSDKYRKNKINYFNNILIEKIYKEKKEIQTIAILEKKYIDIINEIKEKDLRGFLSKIAEKENEEEKEKKEQYINGLEKIFINYENWFKSKRGRASKKKKNEEKSGKKMKKS